MNWNLLKYRVFPKVPIPTILSKPINVKYGQPFGYDFLRNGKSYYGQWGLKGHNGIDFPAPVGTDIVAPCDLYVGTFKWNKTYGHKLWAYSRPFSYNGFVYKLEMVFAHLSAPVKENTFVKRGEVIAKSGNSGYPITSTGPHLHWGVRLLYNKNNKWLVEDFDNGYRGYFNQYLIMQHMYKLKKEKHSIDVYAVDDVKMKKHKICNEFTMAIGISGGLFEQEIEEVDSLKEYVTETEIMLTPSDDK